jgi:uncharacterized protein (DUF427 family)
MQGGKRPGPEHPITIEAAKQRVVVRIGETTVADSSHALVLREANYPAVFYIPRGDVATDKLAASSTRTHCPYKGDASYFSSSAGERRARDVAWSYEDPFDAMASIKDHLAFYPDRVDAIETLPL